MAGAPRHLIDALLRVIDNFCTPIDKSAEADMAARIGVTIVALLLAAIAFLGGGPMPAGLLNPFGILFLFLAVLIWFAWETILGGFASGRSAGEGAELPLLARFETYQPATSAKLSFGRTVNPAA
jgi:hypothetical protein